MFPKACFVLIFYISFSLFCRKSVQSQMRRFWAKKCRRDHLRSLRRSVIPVMIRRWQRREAAKGRWGSLTKCGITKLVTVCHGYDGLSCRFIMKIREVIPVPRFQELKCFETKTLDGPLRLWRSVILVVEGGEESSRRNCTSMGQRSPWQSVLTTTIRRVVHRPNRSLADFQQIESLFN